MNNAGLIHKLAENGRFDGTQCIRRTVKIDKLALGGSRDENVHLNSLEVIDSDLYHQKEVLIIDDVTTSGNSLKVCRQLFLNKGATSVQCLALGLTA